MDGCHLEGRLFVPFGVIKGAVTSAAPPPGVLAVDERGYAAKSPSGLPSRTIFPQ
jgi:hypothetical protein